MIKPTAFNTLSGVVISLLICITPSAARQCADFVPDRSMAVLHVSAAEGAQQPVWKNNWDQARQYYRQKKYELAEQQYRLLLNHKKNIDQARWEFVSLLTCQKQWKDAEQQLAILISRDTDKKAYKLTSAHIALGKKDYRLAVHLFAAIYFSLQDTIPVDHSLELPVLQSYIAALEGLGRFEVLIPLLEQLVRLQPEDIDLKKKVALVAMKNGQPYRALRILLKLEKKFPDNWHLLEKIANAYLKAGKTDDASLYWQKLVAVHKGARTAHEHLVTYYEKAGNIAMVLRHLEHLINIDSDNLTYMSHAAHLYAKNGRSDRALNYANTILQQQPDNIEIRHFRKKEIHEVATQLFALIENNGSKLLWRDLVEMTTDRDEIYCELADMLRHQGKEEELIEILTILHEKNTADERINVELSNLLRKQSKGVALTLSRQTVPHSPALLTQ